MYIAIFYYYFLLATIIKILVSSEDFLWVMALKHIVTGTEPDNYHRAYILKYTFYNYIKI